MKSAALAGMVGVAALPVLLGFGAPVGLALLGALACFALASRVGPGSALCLVAGAGASLGLYALALGVSGLEDAIYYRPHERYARWDARHGHRAYEPRVAVRLRMPHGDLQSFTTRPIAEPREILFVTDEAGFRNRADYADQAWVTLGDSFVAGAGSSQEALLSERLDALGYSTYNLGFPGGIRDYEAYWRAFRRRHEASPRALLFLFEGNDFPEREAEREATPWRDGVKRVVRDATAGFRALPTSRVTRSLVARVAARRSRAEEREVWLVELAGAQVAFYTPYVERTRGAPRGMVRFDAALTRLAPELHAVFFIPTKFRVYQPWVAPEEVLPHARWAHLEARCRELELRCFDLTPALIEDAAARLAEGHLLFWRDDTHWKDAGIDAAARRVVELLSRGARA